MDREEKNVIVGKLRGIRGCLRRRVGWRNEGGKV